MDEMTIEELRQRVAEAIEQTSMSLTDDQADDAEQLDEDRAEMQRLFGGDDARP